MGKWVTYRIYSTGSGGRMSAVLKRRMSGALLAVGNYWHRYFLKRHFALGAFLEYGSVYQARTAGYTRRKLKKKGLVAPLMWSGKLMRAVMTQATVRSNDRSVWVEMNGPGWFKGLTSMHKAKFRKSPNLRGELKAVSPRERIAMAKRLKSELANTH